MTNRAGKSKTPVKKGNGKIAAEARERATAVENASLLTTADSTLYEGTRIGPVIEGEFLHFSPFDLTRYELVQQRVMSALQSIGLKQQAIELLKKKFEEEESVLSTEASNLTFESRKHQQARLNLQQELAGLY